MNPPERVFIARPAQLDWGFWSNARAILGRESAFACQVLGVALLLIGVGAVLLLAQDTELPGAALPRLKLLFVEVLPFVAFPVACVQEWRGWGGLRRHRILAPVLTVGIALLVPISFFPWHFALYLGLNVLLAVLAWWWRWRAVSPRQERRPPVGGQ